eukprot:Nitzschia sp. Nitz4//scaffold174_size87051//527//2499//NITZ4_005096-RA/size87051-augustus-gene-0.49-mRNA-1//1//CDS//3329538833//222//frame0
MPGQSSEEAAELVATIRREHVVMKNWFMGPSREAGELRNKYGPYPGLWKEVLNWPGWKEARKAYLKSTQAGDSSSSGAGAATSSTSTEIPRKRRSRWGTADDNGNLNNSSNNNNNGHGNDGPAAKQRRSRWGREPTSGPPAPSPYERPGGMPPQGLPGLGLPGMPQNLTPQQQNEFHSLQARLREINNRLDNVETEAARVDALERGHRDRSPSPPPIYGADGKRKNTRAVRWRQRFSTERQEVLDKLMNLNPATRTSALFKRKRTRKVRIPIEEHPTYNFIGLIIGPRGKTQKELEAKTGCKIAIRGRGSVKEGARGRRDGKVMESDDEPLHVVITGDDQRSVDAATDMVEQMLVVIDDEKNVHKQQQLRELALLNGTLKEDEFCTTCGEKGHRSFECPRRFSMKKPAVQVRCAICGDTSHPTRDCTQQNRPAIPAANEKQLDSDYMNFMAELDGKKVEAPPAGKTHPADPGTAAPPSNDLPPPPPNGLPPPPVGGPPPPPAAGGPPPPAVNLPPPPPPQGGPPPPAGGPPPPANNNNNNYYGNPQHQQPPHYGNQPYHQGQPQQHNYYGQQQQQQQKPPNTAASAQDTAQQWQQQQQGGWNYQNYYGNAGGAGGFNWWDNN